MQCRPKSSFNSLVIFKSNPTIFLFQSQKASRSRLGNSHMAWAPTSSNTWAWVKLGAGTCAIGEHAWIFSPKSVETLALSRLTTTPSVERFLSICLQFNVVRNIPYSMNHFLFRSFFKVRLSSNLKLSSATGLGIFVFSIIFILSFSINISQKKHEFWIRSFLFASFAWKVINYRPRSSWEKFWRVIELSHGFSFCFALSSVHFEWDWKSRLSVKCYFRSNT